MHSSRKSVNVKQIEKVKEICKLENDIIYIAKNGLYVRDVVIDGGIGEEVYVAHISDIHLNYCNKQDFDEAEPVLMSTYENRVWCANGETVPKLQRALEFLDDADQLIVNGDTLDYLSYGTMEIMDRELWDKYPNVIATLGGHEVLRKMQGKVEDTLSREDRLAILEKFWKHDMYYVSRIIKNKVMVIGMFNDLAQLGEEQKQKLEADIKTAKEKGYVILIFVHEPIATYNPEYKNFTEDMAMLVGDPAGFPQDFCDGISVGYKKTGSDECDEITKSVYSLIVNNADVVKGVFTAHHHSDMHLNIIAKTSNGMDAIIPQFVNTALAYDYGHVMRIFVK